jgi:hypothetical protein
MSAISRASLALRPARLASESSVVRTRHDGVDVKVLRGVRGGAWPRGIWRGAGGRRQGRRRVGGRVDGGIGARSVNSMDPIRTLKDFDLVGSQARRSGEAGDEASFGRGSQGRELRLLPRPFHYHITAFPIWEARPSERWKA